MAGFLDNRLREFISEHVGSVEQLEILLLLASDSAKSWTVEEVFRVVQSNRDSIEHRLNSMVLQGLFELDDTNTFRYKPNRKELAECVTGLDAAYKQSRVKVIEAIYSPIDSARSFADSFKFKTEK